VADCDHEWEEIHHYGEDLEGRLIHYCPTGFKWCRLCRRVEDEDNPQCHLWGEPDPIQPADT